MASALQMLEFNLKYIGRLWHTNNITMLRCLS